MQHIDRLMKILSTHKFLVRDLELVRDLQLPNWCIAAGYVRNFVWDNLHGYSTNTELNDVDILYYDAKNLNEATEKTYESILKNKCPNYNWSCKNQARMHVRNQAYAYTSVENAMLYWPETATAIGIRLDDKNTIEIIAPNGLDDLFSLVIRKSPYFTDREYFLARVNNKKWLAQWPKLRLLEENS